MSKQNVLELHAQLFRRIARRDLEAVEDSLDLLRGQNFSKIYERGVDPEGRTPLFAAVDIRNPKILKAVAAKYSPEEMKARVLIGGKEYTATVQALASNNADAVDFFIKRGCYNLEANTDPALTSFPANDAVRHLAKTRDLYSLLRNGEATLQAVEKLVNDGAVVTSAHLQNYVARKSLGENQAEIEKVVRYLIEKGVKVNAKFHYVDLPPVTPLQKAVNSISFTAASGDKVIDKRSTHVAVALLKNSAGFNLDAKQKEDLVKGILKHDPEYIKTLLAKRWIKKDFKVGGLSLSAYAASVNLDQSLVEFIADQPLDEDLIYKKKQKSLKDGILLKGRQTAAKDVARNMQGELVAGLYTSDDVHFSTIQEAGRTKKFLEKRSDSVAQHFGNQLLRVLSNGQYVVKRGVMITGKDGKPYFATKWDDAVAGNYFLQKGVPKKTEGREFLKNYARLCGVVQVLGEHDWNSRNFLKSDKDGKPVKIDNTPLVNGYVGDSSHRIYGSHQSRAFLHLLAGDSPMDEWGAQSPVVKISKKLEALGKSPHSESRESLEAESRAFIDGYREGIDSKLLERIKRNIARDPDLKAAFIEFMAGIKDTIDLANDQQFLDEYSAKYQQELGVSAEESIKICRNFLQQNAEEAQQQFKNYLAYYKELAPQHYAKTAKSMTRNPVAEFAQIVDKGGSGEERVEHELVDLFADLDVNAKVIKGNKSSSLLQYTLDAIDITSKKIDFENVFIAILLVQNGARFNDLTNQQKSKFVRAVMRHDPQYLKTLLDRGVVDQNLAIEKVENGVVTKTPIKKYISELKSAPQEIKEIFNPAMAVSVKPAVIAPKAVLAPSRLVTAPTRTSTRQPIIATQSVVAVKTPAMANPRPAAVGKESPPIDSGISAKKTLDHALAKAAQHQYMLNSGEKQASILAKFNSACEKISRLQNSRKEGFTLEELIKELWPAPKVQIVNGKAITRPQTPRSGQLIKLDEREQMALSLVALSLTSENINAKELQTPKSQMQVFTNLEEIGSEAIQKWLDSKAQKAKPSTKPTAPRLDKKLYLGAPLVSVQA